MNIKYVLYSCYTRLNCNNKLPIAPLQSRNTLLDETWNTLWNGDFWWTFLNIYARTKIIICLNVGLTMSVHTSHALVLSDCFAYHGLELSWTILSPSMITFLSFGSIYYLMHKHHLLHITLSHLIGMDKITLHLKIYWNSICPEQGRQFGSPWIMEVRLHL